MNITVNSSNLDQLQNMLYPELLEDSKLISIINEELKFKVDELLNLKDIQKITADKAELINLLKEVKFVKLDETSEICTIVITDEFTMVSLLNIPVNINKKSDILPFLKIDGCDRLYKKNSFVWYLVTTEASSKEKILNSLKTVQFNDEKLKFELYSMQIIKKNIIKRIQHINYQKEASDLKSNHIVNSCNSSEAGSWRKKSTDSEEKGSNNKNSVTNTESNPSSFRRKRFNSDGADSVTRFNNAENPIPFKKGPSSDIKFRYNLKQLFDVFEKSNEYFSQLPNFLNFVDDVCSKEKRNNLNILSPVESPERLQRDRSKTFHIHDNDFRLDFKIKEAGKIVLPKNNRKYMLKVALQDFDNIVI